MCISEWQEVMMSLYLGRQPSADCVTIAMTASFLDWEHRLKAVTFFHQCPSPVFSSLCLLPASTVLKGLPAACLLWEQNPVKGPSRHKMASDSPTQSPLSYTHIFTHIQEHCQLHTGHSGKSQLREQPLCVWERWSFLKRFTAVWNSRPLSLLITTPWTC